MTTKKLNSELVNKSIKVDLSEKFVLPAENGVPDELALHIVKENFLATTVFDMTKMIETKKHFPTEDSMEIDMKASFVVVDEKVFNKMLELINGTK